jgi:hypothetical protein
MEKLFEDARLGLDPVRGLRLLADWHVLGVMEPGLSLPSTCVGPLRRLGRFLREAPWPVRQLRPWVPGFALWLAPLEAALRRRTLRRFMLSGAVAQRIVAYPRARDRWLRALGRARGRGEIDRLLGELDEEMLLALHCAAPTPVRRRIARYVLEDRTRRTPVTGADLVGLGLVGPAVGRGLARIRAAHLDGILHTREEALALARELARRPAPRARRGRSSGPAERGPTG